MVVDADYRTSVPSVYALGDVTGRVQLTPVALGEAMAFAAQLFGQGRRKLNYDHIPTVVFTHPNIGTVGYGAAQAREMFGEVPVYRSAFRPLKNTLSGRPEPAMVKLVDDACDRRPEGHH